LWRLKDAQKFDVIRQLNGANVDRRSVAILNASQMQRKTILMKTATFPSVRVDPQLRDAAESVLRKGETLTSLLETAMRETIQRRQAQDEFVARGLRARDSARESGAYHVASEVHAELKQRLDARRKQVLG
jgi:hypothetical protein